MEEQQKSGRLDRRIAFIPWTLVDEINELLKGEPLSGGIEEFVNVALERELQRRRAKGGSP